MPKNLGVDTFPDPFGHFGAHWQAVWRCRLCGVAGGERVPPAPLGWNLGTLAKKVLSRVSSGSKLIHFLDRTLESTDKR